MVHINLIKDNQVTTEDVSLATKAYGSDMGAIKGKQQELSSYLSLAISSKYQANHHEIYYRTAQYVKDTLTAEYEKSLDEIKALYDREGFTITKIHCDNKFHKTMDSFATEHTPLIRIDVASAQEHVP
eukprot:6744765-Ditylum_brightwellii.AAC.1